MRQIWNEMIFEQCKYWHKIVRSVNCEPFSFQHLISFFRLKWPKEKASELEEKFEASLRFIFLFTFYNTLTRSYLGEHEVLMQLTTRKGLSRNVTRNAQSVHSYFELIFLLFILPLSELLDDFHTCDSYHECSTIENVLLQWIEGNLSKSTLNTI